MPRTIDEHGNIVFEGQKSIALYRLVSLKYALKLEVRGIKMTRKSVYAQIKREFNLKGNKQKVYNQFIIIVDKALADDPLVKED